MAAVSRLGTINIGTEDNPFEVDTNTFRGARMAWESGHPEVLKAKYREAVRLGGGHNELAAEIFQTGMTGGRMNTYQSQMVFDALGSGGLPDAAAYRAAGKAMGPGGKDPFATEWDEIQKQDAMEWARIRAQMEGDVYERIGKALMPVAMDFKKAALTLAENLAELSGGMHSAADIMGEIGPMIAESMQHIEGYNQSGMTPVIFEAVMASQADNILDFMVKRGVIGAAQLGAHLGQTVGGNKVPPKNYSGSYR